MAQVFDTYANSQSFDDFITNKVRDGLIIIAACKDDCVTNLSRKGKEFFAHMGSEDIWDLEYREGFAFIGVTGGKDSHDRRAPDSKRKVIVDYVFLMKDPRKAGELGKDDVYSDPFVTINQEYLDVY